jgi:ankyrin repeat protein
MQYKPNSTPSPDADHGHGHGHDHGGSKTEESLVPIRELLTQDYTKETKDVDWSVLTERDENGFLRFHYAVMDGQIPLAIGVAKRFPVVVNDNSNIRKQTPLHWAVLKNRLALVVFLCEHGADVNVVDTEGYSALATAVQFNLVPVAHYLVTKGARLDTVDNEGHTLLHWGAYFGHERIVDYLLVQHLASNAVDYAGRTPLHWASLKARRRKNKCLFVCVLF